MVVQSQEMLKVNHTLHFFKHYMHIAYTPAITSITCFQFFDHAPRFALLDICFMFQALSYFHF